MALALLLAVDVLLGNGDDTLEDSGVLAGVVPVDVEKSKAGGTQFPPSLPGGHCCCPSSTALAGGLGTVPGILELQSEYPA